jgi:hypothetical protein
MGITFTFSVADGDTTYIGLPCRCAAKVSCLCEDFEHYGMCDHTLDELRCEHKAFNQDFTGSNAYLVLDAMGIERDYSGVVEAAEFLTKAAAALAADDGTQHRRLTGLVALGTEAVRRRVDVGWG